MKTVVNSNSSLLTILRSRSALILIAFTLMAFGLAQRTQAVNPPPDGGYPGGNTAEGQAALLSLTSGTFNTAAGLFSLRALTEGKFNTALGAGTLLANTADQNTATGAGALLSNTTGHPNTATGAFALFSNTEGGFNTANGAFALQVNTIGERNTATGDSAMFGNTTGNGNTANGFDALFSNTEGDFNTTNGAFALFSNTTGNNNTAIGFNALFGNSTGNGNIALGFGAGVNVTAANNVICIGHPGANVDNGCFIGNIFDAQVGIADALPVLIDSFGKLGTMRSSRRFKEQIKPMEQASEAILALKPVTFSYKSDNTNTPQFGLIAEEVAEVNPNLVVRDKDGEIYTVRYDAVNAMLLNEFLKEHQKVEEQDRRLHQQGAMIAQQQKQIEALTAGLQKVSAHIEASKPAPQVVNNP